MQADGQNAIPSTPSAFSRLSTLNPQPLQIPDHELLCLIGRGAYGEVWLARNAIGKLRAVKIVHRQSFQRAEHFEREFKGLLKFEPISRSHDGLVDILQIGRRDDAGYFFYVMELADDGSQRPEVRNQRPDSKCGESNFRPLPSDFQFYQPRTLRSLLRSDLQPSTLNPQPATACLPPAECVALGLKLASALEHLHANGLVHRDIKPSNIIFVNGEPKLADIGLVTAIDEAHSLVGTVGYIPPEGPGTPQADLYSLGKVLYEIAFGKDRQDFPQLPLDLQSHPDYTELLELNEIILKACETDSRKRYQTAEQVRVDLALLQEGGSVRRQRSNERRRAVVKTVGIALFIFAAITMAFFSMVRRDSHPRIVEEGLPSTNQYANALCDKAMNLLRADESIGSPEAYTNLLKAIELDPNFARAYIGLFDLRVDRFVPGLPKITSPELRRIVTKLAEVGPDLPSTHNAQSILAFEELDFPSAEQHALKAIEADPSPRGVSWYCFMLVHWGRPKEARERLQRSGAFASSGGFAYRVMGHSYYVERDFTNAIVWYRQAIAWEPRQAAAYSFMGSAYRALRDFTNAFDNKAMAEILWGADESQTKQKYDRYRASLAEGGERGYWEERLKRAKTDPASDHYSMACIQIQLGETNAALHSLNQCYEKRERVGMESLLIYLVFDDCWDGLRGDRRVPRIAR